MAYGENNIIDNVLRESDRNAKIILENRLENIEKIGFNEKGKMGDLSYKGYNILDEKGTIFNSVKTPT